jgi:diguanylate cyclase
VTLNYYLSTCKVNYLDHFNFTSEQLRAILKQLNQAIINHSQWHSELIRSITCKLPPNPKDLGSEPHKLCNFGRWYYGIENMIPKTHPKFSAIESKHKTMHQMATNLLNESKEIKSVSVENYDNFSIALDDLRAELNDFKLELENLLYEHDPLTGASTRLSLIPTLYEQQELTKRGLQSEACIAMMDLDYFKKVNDVYGHLAGDIVLSTVINYIKDELRSYDKVFRYGGEEFIILMQHTNLETGFNLLERLRKGIETLSIEYKDNVSIKVTASFGLVILDQNQPVDLLVELVDKAMYQAKAAGRNCIKIGE